jgi:hypothetical protein
MGELRQHIEDYLRLRRAVGYKLEGAGRLLADYGASPSGPVPARSPSTLLWHGPVSPVK